MNRLPRGPHVCRSIVSDVAAILLIAIAIGLLIVGTLWLIRWFYG